MTKRDIRVSAESEGKSIFSQCPRSDVLQASVKRRCRKGNKFRMKSDSKISGLGHTGKVLSQ